MKSASIDQLCINTIRFLSIDAVLRSLRDGRVFDMPPQTVERYLINKTEPLCLIWCFNHKIRSVPVGKILRIVTMAPAVCHWSTDDWQTTYDSSSRDTGLGFQVVDLTTATLTEGKRVRFTFLWPDVNHWEGVDFMVHVYRHPVPPSDKHLISSCPYS